MSDFISEYEQTKDNGDKHYKNKFKNRTQGYMRSIYKYRPKYLGNCISSANSRPSGGTICNARLSQKMINFNIVQHTEIDTIPLLTHESEKTIQYRKSTIQTIVPYKEKQKMNQQINTNPLSTKYHVQKNMAKLCNLKHINKRLWLGNINLFAWFNMMSPYSIFDINHIIDFSAEGDIDIIKPFLSRCNYYRSTNQILGTKISRTHIEFPDSLHISYEKFKNILFRAINKINSIPKNKNILLICNAGINRSVSIAIGYAMICEKMTFEDALLSIEKDKSNDQWYNLTNLRLMRLLRDSGFNSHIDIINKDDISDDSDEESDIVFETTN
jgi:hypothetical protein